MKTILSYIFILFIVVFISSCSKQGDFRNVSGSMEPTIMAGNYITIDRNDSILDYNKIIVIKEPLDTAKMVIKRCLGFPGDTIRIENGFLYRNNQKLIEEYVKNETKEKINDVVPLVSIVGVIPEDHILVLGDNRNQSIDSRNYGFVPYTLIVGIVEEVNLSFIQRIKALLN